MVKSIATTLHTRAWCQSVVIWGADLILARRHPVRQEYLPVAALEKVGVTEADRKFLHKDGDRSDKTWNEDLLEEWEYWDNGGQQWEGRPERLGVEEKLI